MSLLGLDVGTTGVKAVAFNEEGGIIASAYREYPLILPQPGWAELDSGEVWRKAEQVLGEVGRATSYDPVKALAVSSMGEALTLIDDRGGFLDNAIISFDARTADDLPWWEENLGRRDIYQVTGHTPSPVHTALKLKWIRDHKPEVYNRARKVLLFSDLVYYKLCGSPKTDYTMAGRTMLFDVRREEWSDRIFEAAGLRKDLFWPLVPSGTVIGTISTEAGQRLGFSTGATLVTGGHDQPVASLGSGVIRPNIGMYGVGTVECIAVAVNRSVINEKMMNSGICCYHHARPGMYISLIYNFTGGSLFRWYRDVFCGEEKTEAEATGKDVYDILTSRASRSPTNLLVLPHFTSTGTPHFDSHSRGAILGLQLSTTKDEITRAILEGVTYELKQCVGVLAEAGVEVRELRATGGGSRSDYWMQIKADIMNVPVVAMDTSEAGCLGCAILAGVATGVYSSYEEATEILAKPRSTFHPIPANADIYTGKMESYRRVYPLLKDLSHGL